MNTMNTNKTIFAITIVIVILLATLCGCMEASDAQSNENDAKGDNQINDKIVQVCEATEIEIIINGDTDFNEEIIKLVETSRTPNKENRREYSVNKISDIKEFYNLDNFIIDDYRLYFFIVGEGGFVYHFAPIEMIEIYGERFISESDIIKIRIRRPDYMIEYLDLNDPFRDVIEQAKEQGWEYIYKDDMFYDRTYNGGVIRAVIDDTLFSIKAPDKLSDYEYLRELACKLIETAELVVVGE